MKIIIIVVLYKCKINKSRTIRSLINIYRNCPQSFTDTDIIIYDNGQENQKLDLSLTKNFSYIKSENNSGLSTAYNYALTKALKENAEWLLLFDQDTKLPENYFNNLLIPLTTANKNKRIKAVVPKIHYKNNYFSPSKVFYGGILRPINMDYNGIYDKEIFAIGSGSMLRVDFISEVGGFNNDFWLDSLDRWIYNTIYEEEGKVMVTNNILEHELSVLDYDSYVSEERYKNIIKYEALFMNNYKSNFQNIIYYIRLLIRVITLFIKEKNKNYSSITLSYFFMLIKNKIIGNSIYNINE
jgi:hypothetical protein